MLLSAWHYCSLAAQDDEKWTLSQYMQCTTGFLNTPNSRIVKFWILAMLILYFGTAKTDRVANFVELSHVETCTTRLKADNNALLSCIFCPCAG